MPFPPILKCPKCGRIIIGIHLRCPNCGAKILFA